jgi:hypothetical protein
MSISTRSAMGRTRMRKLALLLSLLALGALGLVASGGGNADAGTMREAKVPPDTTTEARFTTEGRLSGEQVRELKRVANKWAALFAVTACNRFMGQPICVRLLGCRNQMGEIIENCTPPSKAFRKSFADATVEDIKFKGIDFPRWANRAPSYLATVKFSNGVVVVFREPPGPEPPAGRLCAMPTACIWTIAEAKHNRRFLRAATNPR